MTTLLLASIAMSQLPVSASSSRNQGFDPARIEKLSSRLDEMVKEGYAAGTVTLVRRKGNLAFFHVNGFADLEAKTPMKADTVFQVMSMTKPVTATAVMLCVEEGLLGLDDPAENYLPGLKGVKVKNANGGLDESERKLTIRHLLSHQSGLESNDPGKLTDEAKAILRLADYAKLIGTEPLIGQPGKQIRYSGVGMSALAAIVEKVSKTPFETFCQKRIFDPLGMKETTFFIRPDQRDRLAQVYSGEIGALKVFEHDRFRAGAKFPNGAGGLYSTAQDMSLFIDSFVNGKNALLSDATINVMRQPHTGNLEMDGGTARGFGLGFSVVKTIDASTTLRPIGSFGHTGAFGTEYWADPETGISAVFMAQTFLIPEDLRKRFTTMVWAARVR